MVAEYPSLPWRFSWRRLSLPFRSWPTRSPGKIKSIDRTRAEIVVSDEKTEQRRDGELERA